MNSIRKRILDSCATLAQALGTQTLKAWFNFTAYVPRPLPTSHEQLDQFRHIAQKYYGLQCSPDQWITICGQITSTPANSLRKSYGSIINAAKRLNVNAVAHAQKMVAADQLKAKLEEIVEREAKASGSEKPKEL